MAASRTKQTKATLPPEVIERQLAEVRARLVAEGAVKCSTLKPKALQEHVVAALSREGYELTPSWIRRPVEQQLREALRHGALVTKKLLGDLVRGVTAPDLQRALTDLERRGEVRRVLRGKTESFTGPDTHVLDADALRGVNDALADLVKMLGAARKKKGTTLLASDVEECLSRIRAAVPRPPRPVAAAPAAPSTREDGGLGSILDALDATRDERTGLSFVPRLMERLSPQLPVAIAHEALLDAARKEVIELRPEGGLGRLTDDELRLCPPGPGGTPLSWARRLDAGAA
jgi:hypothetical protein